ncbi:hypothetical protein DPMN_048771 [Dreissena polymorpha]|uniref:Uncharacterized protein n=1 Tax=Dreissena polymorpha TaxID=45954 RepID=A0A9D4DC85_DREPO|nr:hypothetical protein DPMN_048771 [Dreissena polymorpha]
MGKECLVSLLGVGVGFSSPKHNLLMCHGKSEWRKNTRERRSTTSHYLMLANDKDEIIETSQWRLTVGASQGIQS